MYLKEIREAKGLTQQQLADMLGIRRNTVSRYETSEREPDQATLISLARILETTVDQLLTGEEQKKASDNESEDDASVLLDSIVAKVKAGEPIQFNGYTLSKETAESLAASIEATDRMTAALAEKERKEKG